MHNFLVAVAAAGAFAAAAPAQAADAGLLIRSATVVDVANGRLIPRSTVLVRDGSIVSVTPDAKVQGIHAGRTIDAHGKFLMPGLWDMHMHFGGGPELVGENLGLMPLYVANGITAVRDCAGDEAQEVLKWRDEIAAGRLMGPTIFTSGPKLEGYKPVWKGTLEVGTQAEVEAALDKLQAMRVDFVKITDNTLKPDIFLYAVGQAHARGLKTSAHIPLPVTIEQATAQGLSSIEHMDYAVKAGSTREAEIAADYAAGRITYQQAFHQWRESFDPKAAMAAYRRMAARGVAITPTLGIERTLAYLDRDDHSHDAYLGLIGPGLRATYDWRIQRAAKADAEAIADRHALYEKSATLLPMLRDAGVMIMAGTDAGVLNSYDYPGLALHEELELFVANGLTPLQALQASVIAGPKFLGHSDRYGAVAAGKAADLVLLDRDPLKDVAATRAIDGVILHGHWYDRAALDAMLSEARTKASGK
jgi:imidazolonepropionase-like amidohydrolase